MYKLSCENVEKLEGVLDYYIEKISDLEDYEVAKQNIFIVKNIIRILDRFSEESPAKITVNVISDEEK